MSIFFANKGRVSGEYVRINVHVERILVSRGEHRRSCIHKKLI